MGLALDEVADQRPAHAARAVLLPLGAQRTAAYTKIQRRWAEDYMVLSMLACFANLVVSGSHVKHMNTAALANHRCYMEKASV